MWALFYAFKILVNLTLLYCEAACWNLLGQTYLMLHRYKQRPRDLYFQISRCFNILDIPRLVKCLVWNWDKILQNSPSLDGPLYTPNGVHNVRCYFIYFTITKAKNVLIILHLHISIMFFVCWPNITFQYYYFSWDLQTFHEKLKIIYTCANILGDKQCKKQKKVGECKGLSYHISISCWRVTKSGTYPLKTKETTSFYFN